MFDGIPYGISLANDHQPCFASSNIKVGFKMVSDLPCCRLKSCLYYTRDLPYSSLNCTFVHKVIHQKRVLSSAQQLSCPGDGPTLVVWWPTLFLSYSILNFALSNIIYGGETIEFSMNIYGIRRLSERHMTCTRRAWTRSLESATESASRWI